MGDDDVHFQSFADSIQNIDIVGFDQRNYIRPLGLDNFRQRISAAFAAVEDVVGKEPQLTQISPAPQFKAIIGQRRVIGTLALQLTISTNPGRM
jgi:hypothetical protein